MVMMVAQSPSGAAISSCHECVLSQLDARPSMFLGRYTPTHTAMQVQIRDFHPPSSRPAAAKAARSPLTV